MPVTGDVAGDQKETDRATQANRLVSTQPLLVVEMGIKHNNINNMKITNPTEDTIEVKIEGKEYKIEGGETKSISEKHARHWKKYLHGFMELEGEESDEVEESPEEEVEEEVEEEDKEEEVEEEDEEEEEVEEDEEDVDDKAERLAKLAEAKGIDITEYDSLEELEEAINS